MGCFGHRDPWREVVIERKEDRFGASYGAEHRENEVGQAVAVAVQGGDVTRTRSLEIIIEQPGVAGVYEDGKIRHVWTA